MGYRHLPNSSAQMFGTDQDHYQSHVTAQRSHIHMGRSVAPVNVSMFNPVENTLVSHASQRGLECRPIAHSLSSVRLEPLRGAIMGPAFDPIPHFPVRSFNQTPPRSSGHTHTSYYHSHPVHETAPLVEPTTGVRRGPFKRKSPSISVASERGISTFYGAQSSSSSSQLQLEKSTSHYQTSEASQRNVRSRSRLDLEPTARGTYLSTYSNHYSLMNQSGSVDVTNFNSARTTNEQNHAMLFPARHSRFLNSGYFVHGLNQEMKQFPIGGSTAESGGPRYDSIPRRNSVLPPHRPNVPADAARDINSSISGRAVPYRADLSFSSLGHETVPSGNGPPYRYTRLPSARRWRNSYRDERSRMATQRSASLSNAVYTRDRLGSESFMMADHSSMRGSRNLFDQYGDMRVDVDNMSYEELLALGERIGNVNTGLSGDMIFKCLETSSSSSDHNLKENCAICLEEYTSKEEVGTLRSCGHNYHASCIKKWLSMKNACPICKAPALSDSPKEH